MRVRPGLARLLIACAALAASVAAYRLTAGRTVRKHSTAAQAILVATNFCKAIGQPVTGAAIARFPVPDEPPDGQQPYYLPRWQIVFPGQATLHVVDGASIVTYFQNTSGKPGPPRDPHSPTPTAMQVFSKLLTASGIAASEIDVHRCGANYGDGPAGHNAQPWEMEASRAYNGIDYANQSVTVATETGSGNLQWFVVNFPSPPPASSAQTITSAQAMALANTALQTAGESRRVHTAPVLCVVQPNTRRILGGGVQPIPGVSKVVWCCDYSGAGHNSQIWIDAATGERVGGDDAVSSNN